MTIWKDFIVISGSAYFKTDGLFLKIRCFACDAAFNPVS